MSRDRMTKQQLTILKKLVAEQTSLQLQSTGRVEVVRSGVPTEEGVTRTTLLLMLRRGWIVEVESGKSEYAITAVGRRCARL